MYIDLFAGCGGLSLGLCHAGWRGLFAIEKNVDAFATLKHNLIDTKHHFMWPEWLETENLDVNILLEQHKEQLIGLRNQIELIVGGPPCQGFSMAGKREKNDARNKLYHAYVDFVKLVQPRMLFFENVHGFAVGFQRKYKTSTKKGMPYSQKLIKALKKLGYDVCAKEILMSDYGVPQKRKRFILFATQNGQAKDFFENLQENKAPFLKKKGIGQAICVEDAIGDLKRSHGETQCEDTPRFQRGMYGAISSTYQSLMRRNITGPSFPNSHRFARSNAQTIALFEKLMNVSEEALRITPQMGLVEGLKKRSVTPLKAHCICPTITSIPDDFIHYSEPRIMTVRETARIQSFPDDFIFLGKYTTGGAQRKADVPRYTQVANAVPPLFSEQVGIALRSM